MTFTDPLDKFVVHVKLRVLGESFEDALEYAEQALDSSDILDQDGIIGVELVEDVYSDDEDDVYDDDFREDEY